MTWMTTSCEWLRDLHLAWPLCNSHPSHPTAFWTSTWKAHRPLTLSIIPSWLYHQPSPSPSCHVPSPLISQWPKPKPGVIEPSISSTQSPRYLSNLHSSLSPLLPFTSHHCHLKSSGFLLISLHPYLLFCLPSWPILYTVARKIILEYKYEVTSIL